jgi:DNA sulfur modification protein DndD
MQQSLNWAAKQNGGDEFSVSIFINELNHEVNSIKITRCWNIENQEETLKIIDLSTGSQIFTDADGSTQFINDFVIPVEAAKFVFFDAEKIAEIANLTIKEEGSFINDALAKVLGLDTYTTLIEDLESYIDSLKREGADNRLNEQIINCESAIELASNDIDLEEAYIAEQLKQIDERKNEIRALDSLISLNSQQSGVGGSRELLIKELGELQEKEEELFSQLSEINEIIPLIILTGKLGEVTSHIKEQSSSNFLKESEIEIEKNVNLFIESLFNKPPFPEDSTMSFNDKSFYSEKAKEISQKIWGQNAENTSLSFEHDLTKSDIDLINDAYRLVNSQSDNFYNLLVSEINAVKESILELNKKIRLIDTDVEDDLIIEYIAKKETYNHEIEDLSIKVGERKNKIIGFKSNIERLRKQLASLIKKVDINDLNRKKIDEYN